MQFVPLVLQYPNTPNAQPWSTANGIALMMGVESVLSRSSTNAMMRMIDRGVAGLSSILNIVVTND